MLATQNYYSLRDTAFKVLPTLCTLTVDPDKGVRDQTFKAIGVFLQRLQTVSDHPETAAEIGKLYNDLKNCIQNEFGSHPYSIVYLVGSFYSY